MAILTPFRNVYIRSTGSYLPGKPVDNDGMDAYIKPINGKSARLKRRILAENGIQARHYGIDADGNSVESASGMAVHAIQRCLEAGSRQLSDISLLCTGTSGGDVVAPSFASMVHGALGAPPLEISSHDGICAAGMAALKHAAMALDRSEHDHVLVAVSEFPSRMFKRSRFAPRGYNSDFDAHFLRWMLSDGAGAWLLGSRPGPDGYSLKLHWIHLKSFAGDHPVCMQVGYSENYEPKSYLDYPSIADAEREGAFLLRQNVRILPTLFDIGIHEYSKLVQAGAVDSRDIDHFLCHYSSERFAPVVKELLDRAGLSISDERWYSNLKHQGNIGSASIFVMLDDFLKNRRVKPGEKILCFVPESGRFTVSYALLEVVSTTSVNCESGIPPPHEPETATSAETKRVLQALAEVWHAYRSRLWRTPMLRRIIDGTFSSIDYVRWMESWIPQVREGAQWMRRATSNIMEPYPRLRDIIEMHAADEQFDYEILFKDYQRAGGIAGSVDELLRNPGGDALNAYLHSKASQKNAVGLLGAIYIIEGTGQRIIPAILPLIKKQLGLGNIFRFLQYHGENDIAHLRRWLSALEYVLAQAPEPSAADDIISTARETAELYVMQMEHVK